MSRLGAYEGPLRPGMDIGEIRRLAPRLGPADVRFLRELYDGEVRFLDRAVGRLLDELERRGLADDTVVVLTGDHGEEFFEHGWIGHTRSLHREVVSVPLILAGPGVPAESRPDGAWLLDVAPTLLSLVGLEPGDGPGRDLLGPDRTVRTDFAEVSYDPWTPENLELAAEAGRTPSPEDRVLARSVRKGRWKGIRNVATETWQLFDLARDPGEKNDVAARNPDALRALAEAMDEWRSALVAPESTSAAAPSDAQLERLRALGYLK
ncbi:MAG: hypothetical protein DHS20C21_21930 [Gemmatimonadota bacterium]|nr:MAG: hypothetical protein DHS20C21_21930 [Gemmatimonadota bacterium]